MVLLLFFGLAISSAGALLCAKLFADFPPRQRTYLLLAALPTIVLAFWVAILWLSSVPRLMTPWTLVACASLTLACAFAIGRRDGANAEAWRFLCSMGGYRRTFAVFSPLIAWFTFLLWKGAVLPTNNPDALYLHLPRAVWISRSGGFPLGQAFPTEWASHASYPMNYEGILASILSFVGRDTYTEWFTTWVLGLFCMLVVGAGGTIFERATAKQLAATLMLVVSVPVLILHGAADKVDVAAGLVSFASLFWLYWWMERDTRVSTFLLASISAWLALGFKKTGVIFIAASVLGLGWQAWRRRDLWFASRHLALVLASGVALGLGGLAHNYRVFGSLFGGDGSIQTYVRPVGAPLFDPSQLATYPFLLNAVPFSSNPLAVYVPWKSEWWYWPSTNLFFSHWGVIFDGLVLVSFAFVPLWLYRRAKGDRSATLPLLNVGVYSIIVTKSYAYEGGFNTFPRYTLFYLAFLATWFALPLVARISRGHERWAVGAAFVWMVSQLYYYTSHDTYAPLAEVWRRWEEPEVRRIVPGGARRVTCLLDRTAAPNARIATDLTYMTWIHPLYGKDLSRPVHILHREKDGTFVIPSSAEWVVADNVSNALWGGPQRTAGDQLRSFGKGQPSERDTALYRQLREDPRFVAVYVSGEGSEAVFRRVRQAQAGPLQATSEPSPP